ncbi:uncharacterized protein LOC111027709 [Myzus persicae]|uniref:uncharacterized protein LOC111027709 n=1 Tax=Myzus persicae TaxID=13164 RepID=UPI000B934E05|nr:uncharacterized protein LOC111027709 [Myzus persicae]
MKSIDVPNIKAGKVRIGLVWAKVRLRENVKRCFNCLGYGHTRAKCNRIDHRDACSLCATTGHRAAECSNPPRCVACEDNKAPTDHYPGSSRCTSYKKAQAHGEQASISLPQSLNTVMIAVLQINLNCCKAAQALMHQTALEKSADFVLISEYNRVEGPHWYADATNKAAIVNVKKTRLENEGCTEAGFSWVCDRGLRIYSGYWSPNSTFQEYKDFTSRLEASIRSANTEILLTGDFNAKHTYWGCPQNDRRGEILADLIDATGLVVCNKGNSCTFNRGTIIDLTITTPRTAQRITKWTVLDEESLSDHYYLWFEINTGSPNHDTPRIPKIDLQTLKMALAPETHHPFLDSTDAEQKALSLKELIQSCRRPIYTGKYPRKSVHWWSPEINSLCRTANHFRRVFQRKRKRHGPAASVAEEQEAKTAKRDLV